MMNETFTHTVIGGGSSTAPINNKFITEAAVAEARTEREKEGRKDVEEVYDPRPLYERLAEKKRIEEEEFAERMKFSNMVKRLDDEEYEFLAAYDDEEEKKRQEIARSDAKELEQFRKAVSEAPVDATAVVAEIVGTAKPSRPAPSATQAPARDFQRSILSGIVRKRKASEEQPSSGSPGNNSATSATKKRAVTERTKRSSEGGSPVKQNKEEKAPSAAPSAPNPLQMLAAYDASDSDDD
ncbi:hypothetical protein HDV00_009272 [Rhizophlyctis rosea]|nr:hypothetical protein HDV00_009272 [Rhizophlyctis rosea]